MFGDFQTIQEFPFFRAFYDSTARSNPQTPPILSKILAVLPRLQSAAVQREQWKVKYRKQVGPKVENERKGLSDEMVNEIRRKILGISAPQMEDAQSELDVNEFG